MLKGFLMMSGSFILYIVYGKEGIANKKRSTLTMLGLSLVFVFWLTAVIVTFASRTAENFIPGLVFTTLIPAAIAVWAITARRKIKQETASGAAQDVPLPLALSEAKQKSMEQRNKQTAENPTEIDPETAAHYWAEPEDIITPAKTSVISGSQQNDGPSENRKFKIALVALCAMCAALAVGISIMVTSLVSEKQQTENALLLLQDANKSCDALTQLLADKTADAESLTSKKMAAEASRDRYFKLYMQNKQESGEWKGEFNDLARRIGFVLETGEKYHCVDCYMLEGKSYWIYNVEACEGMGYEPCKHCWQDSVFSEYPTPKPRGIDIEKTLETTYARKLTLEERIALGKSIGTSKPYSLGD